MLMVSEIILKLLISDEIYLVQKFVPDMKQSKKQIFSDLPELQKSLQDSNAEEEESADQNLKAKKPKQEKKKKKTRRIITPEHRRHINNRLSVNQIIRLVSS